jgi:hypothetical protein
MSKASQNDGIVERVIARERSRVEKKLLYPSPGLIAPPDFNPLLWEYKKKWSYLNEEQQ